MTHYLPIAEGKIVEFMPLSWELALCEIKIDSFSIWTQVTEAMSNDYNHYSTSDSKMWW